MKKRRGWPIIVFATGLLLGLACDQEQSDCIPGTEGCVCADGLCLEGLACYSSYCVDPSWKAPKTGGNRPNPTPADDDDAGADAGEGADDADDGGSVDNVAACNALVDELQCGGVDLATAIDCSTYAQSPCDLTDYFDCLRDAITCNGDALDTSQLPTCIDLAQCA